MEQNILKLSNIRKIDTQRRSLPLATTIMLLILIVVLVWFFRGGSFRFYTSMFFGFYDLTKTAWVSIILVGLGQTIIFLPFRFIGNFFHPDLKEFEKELEKSKSDNQYIMFHQKIKEGNSSILFYILNFVFLALAFFSVARVFLLDFYNEPVNPNLLYKFIPYPEYPIQGTIFHFPFFKITNYYSVDWHTIFTIWFWILIVLVGLRLLWTILRKFLTRNKAILKLRISYNRLLLLISGFIGTLFVFSLFFLRHIPIAFQSWTLSADLTKQNTAFNIITAVCTFAATIYFGYKHNREAVKEARANQIPETIIQKVFKSSMKNTIRNAFFVAIGAYFTTHLMPCSHDLSVLSFEAIYLMSPFTFDLLVKHPKKNPAPSSPTLPNPD